MDDQKVNQFGATLTRRCVSAAICLCLSACSFSSLNALNPFGPSTVDLRATGGRMLNQDENGHPLSLVIHVLQLKSNQSFNRLTTADLISGKDEKDLLGTDLIDSTELVLLPGGKSNVTATISPDAEYIAVVGYFRQPEPYFWRLLFTANTVRSNGISILADRCFLRATTPQRMDMPGQPKQFKPACPYGSN
jgi:type VI secretion system protein VasD